MLGLNLKKYCKNNEIVFNPMFTSSGGKLCKNDIVILDVFLNMLIPTALLYDATIQVNRYIILYG